MKRSFIDKCKIVLSVVIASAVLFAAGFAGVADSTGSVIKVDPSSGEEGYSAVLYDNSNGLPTSEANAVASTSDGCLWIGSYGGLIRYDGVSFERIDSTTGISSVCTLYVDSRDRLWIGTNDNGAAVMDKNEIKLYGKQDGLGSATIRAFCEDNNGEVYIATTHGISIVGTDGEIRTFDDPTLNTAYVRELMIGPDGTIFGVTIEGYVFSIAPDGNVIGYDCSKIGMEGVRAICPDYVNPGYVYFGTEKSEIYHVRFGKEIDKERTIYTGNLESINCIREIMGQLWICADNGIGFWSDGRMISMDGLPVTSAVDDMLADFQGNLWFASSRQGVMKIVPNRFADIFVEYGLPSSVVNSTCLCDGRLYIGEDKGLKVVGDGVLINNVKLESCLTAGGQKIDCNDLITLLADSKIRSITKDSSGKLWIASFGDYGLVRFDPKEGRATSFTTEDGLPSNRVRVVFENEDGTMLAACTGGVVEIKGNLITKHYDTVYGLENLEVLTLSKDDKGNILAGTDGEGIYVINGPETRHIGVAEGLSSEVILRIKRDPVRNIFWIVASNALAYLDADLNVHKITTFPYANNFDLYENKSGDMWVLNSNGIHVVPVDELLNDNVEHVSHYGVSDGLPCITTSNSYSALSEDGVLYIAGNTCVGKVNIDEDFDSSVEYKLSVPFIEVDGEKVYPDDEGCFKISEDAQKVSIRAYVYSYALVDPTVRYMLEGFDTEMTSVRRSDMGLISYTNLKGGKYNFIIELENGSLSVKMSIIKTKSLFEKVWFRALLIALLIAGVVAVVLVFVRRRIKKLEKKALEDRKLIREICEAFAVTIDMKDKYTRGHSQRVANYTKMLADELGYDEETVEKYYDIALLHDIGKIGIPADILNKPGKLTDEEFEKIKEHPTRGNDVLEKIKIMPELAAGALSHHERPDGKGYPDHLKGDEIPRAAQIIAVADTFDAMYSDRPYRKRMNFEKVVSIITEVSGTQLTPDVVDAFLRIVEKGGFKAKNDVGGGTFDDIDNIHKKFEAEGKQPEEGKPAEAGKENAAPKDENGEG